MTGEGLSGQSIGGELELVCLPVRGTAARMEVRVSTKERKTGARRWALPDGFMSSYKILHIIGADINL